MSNTKQKTLTVKHQKITIQSRPQTRFGKKIGWYVVINFKGKNKKFLINDEKHRENAVDIAYTRWVLEMINISKMINIADKFIFENSFWRLVCQDPKESYKEALKWYQEEEKNRN